MSNQELGYSLIKTIAQPDAIEAFAELGEVAFDEVIESGLLQDIPFVGTISKLLNAKVKIQEEFFIRKVKKFLLCLQNIDQDSLNKFQQKLQGGSEYSKKVGGKLVIILDRLDDEGKAELLGRLFRAYLEERIHQQILFRLSQAIDKAFFDDLIYLLQTEKSQKYNQLVYEQLQSTGLVKIADFAEISSPNEDRQKIFGIPSIMKMPPPLPSARGKMFDPSNEKRAKIQLVLSELGEVFCEILKNDD
ncbi:MAG: hypothetical protein AB4057_22135 [Crocosphaera sp.]